MEAGLNVYGDVTIAVIDTCVFSKSVFKTTCDGCNLELYTDCPSRKILEKNTY